MNTIQLFQYRLCIAFMSIALIFGVNQQSSAQLSYNTGTGADGIYNATSNTTLAGGTYNYTNFTIQPGVVVTVTGTTPLIIRCTGSALIDGQLIANGGNGANGVTYTNGGAGGIGVSGGGNGGSGSYSATLGPIDAQDGVGDGSAGNKGRNWSGGGGGGYANNGGNASATNGIGGPANGNIMVTNLPGGSGGGGGSGGYQCGAGGGGAGGGLVVINAATSITINGSISSNGGNGGSDDVGNCGGGAGGSGGTIWLASPSFVHNGLLSAIGGIGGASNVAGTPYFGTGAAGSEGRIRVDYDGPLVTSGTNNPAIGYHTSIVNIPLPVLVGAFWGKQDNEVNEINWQSASELNNDSYMLQFSTDAKKFETISTLKSKSINGNSEALLEYSAVHANPVIGHNYYRLQQMDIDGRIQQVSAMIDVLRDQIGNTLSVFPNPCQQEFTCRVHTNSEKMLTIQLVDLHGIIIKQTKSFSLAGQLSYTMNVANLPQGMYFLHVFDGAGFSMKQSINKQ